MTDRPARRAKPVGSAPKSWRASDAWRPGWRMRSAIRSASRDVPGGAAAPRRDQEVTQGIARELERLAGSSAACSITPGRRRIRSCPIDPFDRPRCLRAASGTRRVSQRAGGDRRRVARPRSWAAPRAGADTRQPPPERDRRDAIRRSIIIGPGAGPTSGTIAAQARQRSGYAAVPANVGTAPGARGVCGRTAGGAALRGGLGARHRA